MVWSSTLTAPAKSLPGLSVRRSLEQVQDAQTEYLLDDTGVEYDPYSLAWRYLGMFIDCDLENYTPHSHRNLEEDETISCPRKVMWAAVSKSCCELSAILTFFVFAVS